MSVIDSIWSLISGQPQITSPIAADAQPATSSSGPPTQYYSNPQAYPITQKALSLPVQNNTAPRTVTYSQPSQPSQSNYWDDSKNMGYYNGTTFTDKNQWLKAGGSQDGGDSGSMYDDLYNQGISMLNDNENQIKSDAQSQQDAIERQAGLQKTNLDTEDQNSQAQFDKNSGLANRNKETALSEAMRAYKALEQQSRSRFGGGSSAGVATNELASQEFLKNQGKVETSYSDILNNLYEQRHQAGQFILQKKSELDDWMKTETEKIRMSMANALNQVSAQKFQLASQKVQAKQAVMMQAKQQADQLNAIRLQADTALQNYMKQTDFDIANGLRQVYANPINTDVAQPQYSSFSPSIQSIAQNGLQGLKWNGKNFVDEFGNVISANGALQGTNY